MTLREIGAALSRRWYFPLVALVLAAVAGLGWLSDGGCYTTSTVVTFTLPSRSTLLPESGLDDSNVIAFAGVVAHEINGGRPVIHYASRDAPLYGVGVREGVIAGLPDSGSQWASSFARAEIEIQIVSRSRARVEAMQRQLLNQVFTITSRQQQHSRPDQRISASVLPLTTDIQRVTATRSSQVVAILALTVAAVLVGGWAATRVDRWVLGRRGAARQAERRNP